MEPQGNEGLLEFTEDEVTYEDHDLPNLMVRHSMLTPKASKSDWQRNNIFKTRCSSHGRLCNVIIDKGSCDEAQLGSATTSKAISNFLVKKWGEIKAVQQCLVPSLIGKNYSYKVMWCGGNGSLPFVTCKAMKIW